LNSRMPLPRAPPISGNDDQHDCQLRNANAAHGVFPPRSLVAVQLLAIVGRRRLDRFVQLAAWRIVGLPEAGFQCANGRMVTHHTREHDYLAQVGARTRRVSGRVFSVCVPRLLPVRSNP
jgi:hypothetical protein